MVRANQVVLPMLDLRSFVAAAGETVSAQLHVANDGRALADVAVEVGSVRVAVADLPPHRAVRLADVALSTPPEPGPHSVELRLTARGSVVAENRYELRLVAPPHVDAEVCVLGDGPTADALRSLGARIAPDAPAVVGEEELSPATSDALASRLGRGETVVVLAQPGHARRLFPVDFRIRPLDTRWGSSAFSFTTGRAALGAFPPAGLLVGEDATIHARGLVVGIDGRPYPDEPLVVRYDPMGSAGTLVGAHGVGRGRLVFCQYRLAQPALAGDVAARALLADLVRLAAGVSSRDAAGAPA